MINLKKLKLYFKNCTYYYFDDIIKIEDFYLDNTLMDEKSNENILVYSILYKILITAKPLRWIYHSL